MQHTLNNQKGFTLIELLVVVAIIGILAAIAIPQFSSYRAQAFCSRVESDVKNTVTALEAQYARTQDYTDLAAPIQSDGVTVSMNVAADAITDVTGTHAGCDRGTFTFTAADGTYTW